MLSLTPSSVPRRFTGCERPNDGNLKTVITYDDDIFGTVRIMVKAHVCLFKEQGPANTLSDITPGDC